MLYDYVETGSVEDELTRKIEAAVTKGRKNYLWRSQYMKERVMLMDAREEGIELGIEQGIRMSIENMLRKGKTVDEIVGFCGYEKDFVEQVEKDMPAVAD